MDSYPNPYAALIATFNQVSPIEGQEELEDPQHLAEDDLLLWANAQFTFDIPPGVGIYEDEMGFDALHRYFDTTNSEGRPQELALRRREIPPTEPNCGNGSHVEPSIAFSAPTSAGPISPAAARLLRQPFLALQQHGSPFVVGGSPLPSPTTMSDFRQLQINPPPSPVTTSKPNVDDHLQLKRVLARKDDVVSRANSPAHSTTSVAATVSSPSLHEEKLNPSELNLDDELDADDLEDSLSRGTKVPKAIQGLSPDDPEYPTKLAAEEDKRRRNTAASARFRHKKRLREQILEKTAKEMTTKSELLEIRVKELEMEIKWLRGLIVEKDSRMMDVGISPAAVAAAAAAAAAAASGSPSSGSGSSSTFSLSGTASLSDLSSLSGSSGRVKSESKEGAPRKRSKKATKA
ncbi:hypothetical protein B0O80DRAFT_423919 [Mortierella sp. GBAus27b]|nr:hypothetical protein B0O80DRAFT_423919 [Mortierella sp. GBAus27b]